MNRQILNVDPESQQGSEALILSGQVMQMNLTEHNTIELAFDDLVERFYSSLYKFALSLAHSEAEACDLTQETFYTWMRKGSQLRDASKVRGWLFTTLHRAFLHSRRRSTRFPHYELEQAHDELPSVTPQQVARLDSNDVLTALAKVDEVFRAPVALFYLEDCSYKEIAAILSIPIGTVKSRIARGISQLERLLQRVGPRY